MLKAINLSKRYEDNVLFEKISLQLERRQTAVLFGASGEGKSTLIRILSGLQEPDSGEVKLDGTARRNIDPEDWRRRVVLVHQEPRMFPGSVEDNITLAARHHGITVDTEEILGDLELEIDPTLPARNLSGGEKKRVALGRAIALNPDFLLLDEPTASLDESVRESIDNLILSSIQGDERGVLVVTHNPREVEKFGTTGYLLSDGELGELTRHHLENLKETL